MVSAGEVATIGQELAASHAAWDALAMSFMALEDVPVDDRYIHPLFLDIQRFIADCCAHSRVHRLHELPLRFRPVELPDLAVKPIWNGKGGAIFSCFTY